MQFTNDVNLLGLSLTRTGFTKLINNKINLAMHQSLKLKWFYKLKPHLQVRLYTTLIRPIMEYPPIPKALTSNSLKLKMQSVQNSALPNAVRGAEDSHMTIEQLHEKFGLETMNVRLYNRMTKTWNKIQGLNEELYNITEEANNEYIRDHNWWPRVDGAYVADPLEPMYTTL